MTEHYNEIAKWAKIVAKDYTKLNKCKTNLDRATAMLEIEQHKHKIHCLCVECWIADYDECRYWEKHRWLDDFHERLVNFERPNVK